MTDTEEWRPIPGCPGYEASVFGRIRSWKLSKTSGEPHILKGGLIRKNDDPPYRCVHLCGTTDGLGGTRTVHRMIARTFIGPCPEGMEVRHLDGDSLNNRVDNLKYGTKSENNRDRVKHGTHHNAIKTHCKYGHEYTEDNTYVSRGQSGVQRICRTCSMTRQREKFNYSPRRADYWTHCPQGHEKNEANTYLSPSGARKCRPCRLDQQRARGGHQPRDWTRCKNGHEFTEETTYIVPSSGARQCRICKAQRNREIYLRRKATS